MLVTDFVNYMQLDVKKDQNTSLRNHLIDMGCGRNGSFNVFQPVEIVSNQKKDEKRAFDGMNLDVLYFLIASAVQLIVLNLQ